MQRCIGGRAAVFHLRHRATADNRQDRKGLSQQVAQHNGADRPAGLGSERLHSLAAATIFRRVVEKAAGRIHPVQRALGGTLEVAVGLRGIGQGRQAAGSVQIKEGALHGDHRGVRQRLLRHGGKAPQHLICDKAGPALALGAGLCGGNAFGAPIRAAVGANLAGAQLILQRIENHGNRRQRIVAMEPVEVNHVGLEIAQALIEVSDNRGAIQARSVHGGQLWMGTLGGDDEAIALPALFQPAADGLFTGAALAGQPVCIDPGCIEKGTALGHKSIKQGEGAPLVQNAAKRHAAQTKQRGGQVGLRYFYRLHPHTLLGRFSHWFEGVGRQRSQRVRDQGWAS